MTKDQANQLALALKGLMPAMTNAQVIRAAEMLEPYEPPLAQAAIDALVERHADYSVDRLRACLREAAARLRDPQAERVADERARLAKIGDDDRLFAGIDPRDMGTHVAAVIEQQTALNPIVGKRLAERPDPHANAFLRGLVIEHVKAMRRPEPAERW